MENLLSQCPDLVGEFQCLGKVLEGIFLLQVMSINDLPVIAQFIVEAL